MRLVETEILVLEDYFICDRRKNATDMVIKFSSASVLSLLHVTLFLCGNIFPQKSIVESSF